MSELQKAAQRITALRVLEGVIKEETEQAKAAALEAMAAVGAERVRVVDAAGANLGAVSLATGRTTARVTDERALLEWVKRNHPSELVETVRPAFLQALKDSAVAKAEPGDTTAVGPDGEVLPGMELVSAQPYVAVRATPEAKERMRGLLASGLLQLTANPREVSDRGALSYLDELYTQAELDAAVEQARREASVVPVGEHLMEPGGHCRTCGHGHSNTEWARIHDAEAGHG